MKWNVTSTSAVAVNVRDQPSTTGAVLRTLAPSERIESGDKVIPGYDNAGWIPVVWGDEEQGYVRADLVSAPMSETVAVDLTPPTTVPAMDTDVRTQDLIAFIRDGSCRDLPQPWCTRLQGLGFQPASGGYTIFAVTTLTSEPGDKSQAMGVCHALWQYATNWDQHKDIKTVQVKNAQGLAIATGVLGVYSC